MIATTTPEFLQQLVLSTLLAERSEEVGTDYEEGTYEQGVRDALQWMAGIISVPPHKAGEYPELALPPEALEEFMALKDTAELLRVWTAAAQKGSCPTLGPTCRGCPDCGPVMGDTTYQETYGQRHREHQE